MGVQLRKLTPAHWKAAVQSCAVATPQEAPEWLVQQSILTLSDKRLLEALVDETVRYYDGDSRAALNALGGAEAVENTLEGESGENQGQNLGRTIAATPSFVEKVVGGSPGPGVRYSEVREFARGGMGRILLVHDSYLGRDVALKELLSEKGAVKDTAPETPLGVLSDRAERFLREARITGQLEHPSIVPVYEMGRQDDGSPYYTMKFVRGRSFRTAIADAHTMTERLKLLPHFVDLCQAIAYAHSRNVIHRDLKPDNVMLGEFGETLVIDWGLAKSVAEAQFPGSEIEPDDVRRSQSGEPCNTVMGDVLGTPQYMSPEQVRGRIDLIDHRSDIYALGAILYEMLTGVPPYHGDSVAEILSRAASESPAPVMSLAPDAPKELIAISDHALDMDLHRRYQTARDLIDDVTKYQAGALVGAYEYKPADHVTRFVRKHKVVLAALILSASIMIGLATVYQVQLIQERNNVAVANRELIWENYVSNLSVVQKYISEENYRKALELLEAMPSQHRGWEWGYLHRQCAADALTLTDQAWVEFGYIPTGVIDDAHLSPDGRYLLVDRNFGGVKTVFDLEQATIVYQSEVNEHLGAPGVLHFSPKGSSLLVGIDRHSFTKLAIPSGNVLARVTVEPDGIFQVVSGARGDLVAGRVKAEDGSHKMLIVWDAESFQERARLDLAGSKNVYILGFDPVGNLMYATDHLFRWNIGADKVDMITPAIGGKLAKDGRTAALFILPNRIEIWDFQAEKKLATLDGEFDDLDLLAIHPSGRFVATGRKNELRWDLWDATSGALLHSYSGHSLPIASVIFSDNGRCVITSAGDGAGSNGVKVWDLESTTESSIATLSGVGDSFVEPVPSFDFGNLPLGIDPQGVQFAIGDHDGNVHFWDIPSFVRAQTLSAHTDRVTDIAYSSDGRLFASSSGDGTVKIWTTADYELFSTIQGIRGGPILSVAFSPDGKRIAFGEQGDSPAIGTNICDNCAFVYDVESGQKIYTVGGRERVSSIGFSPDGKWLVTGSFAHSFSIWDAETGQERHGLIESEGWAFEVVFSPDSRYMIAISQTRQPMVWDLDKMEEYYRLPQAEVVRAVFNPEGDRFLTIGRRLRIHSTVDGRELITLENKFLTPNPDRNTNAYLPANFTSSGKQIYARTSDGRMIILETDDWNSSEKPDDTQATMKKVRELLRP